MRLWARSGFDPKVVDQKPLDAAVNALSGIWKPRRTSCNQSSVKTQSKWPQSYAYRPLS